MIKMKNNPEYNSLKTNNCEYCKRKIFGNISEKDIDKINFFLKKILLIIVL